MNEPVSLSFARSVQWPVEHPSSRHDVFDCELTPCDALPAKARTIGPPTAQMVLDCFQNHAQPTPTKPSVCKQALQLLPEFCIVWPVATGALLRRKILLDDITRALSVRLPNTCDE